MSGEKKVPDLMANLLESLQRATAAKKARQTGMTRLTVLAEHGVDIDAQCEDCGGTGESDEDPGDDGDTECQTCDGSGVRP